MNWCDRASEIGISVIALPEIVSALCGLSRERKITLAQYKELKRALLAEIEDAAICDLTLKILTQSIKALESNNLRSMNAIHIGSALALEVDLFVSADS